MKANNNMNAAVQQFSNGQFEIAVEPHPVDGFRVQAPGLARALNIDGATNLLRNIPEEEKGSSLVKTLGGEQSIGHVTEAGFYRALGMRQTGRIEDPMIRARVEAFQNWVYRDVLPSLRVGSVPKSALEKVTKADLAKMILESEEEKSILSAALESATPAIEYHDRFVIDTDVATIKAWGAQFGLSEQEGFNLLRDSKIIYRFSIGKRWSEKRGKVVEEYEHRAYADYLEWFDLRPQHNAPRHHNGQVRQTLYVRQQFSLTLGGKVGLTPGMGQPRAFSIVTPEPAALPAPAPESPKRPIGRPRNEPTTITYQVREGANLRECRERANVPAAGLATAVGISRSTLANYESGFKHIPNHRIAQLAMALGVSPSDLRLAPEQRFSEAS